MLGATCWAVMAIVNCLVLLPATFCAHMVNVNVPALVGVPDIAPVFAFRLKPPGKLPVATLQVIGAVPVA